MENIWRIKVNDWTKISKESAIFIINEAEKYLKYTIEVSDKITNRSFSFLLICIFIFTALIGYTLEMYSDNPIINLNIICNLSILIALLIISYFLILNISPRFFMMAGRMPKEIANNELLNNESLSEELSHLSIILNEIENYQYKIEYNETQNRKRIKVLKRTLFSLIILSALYLISMAITII